MRLLHHFVLDLSVNRSSTVCSYQDASGQRLLSHDLRWPEFLLKRVEMDMMLQPDLDARRTTAASETLRELGRKLSVRNIGTNGQKAVAAITVVADMLAETAYPPPHAHTDALIEVLTLGIRHMVLER
ncbi:hypothetical protein WG901_22805 [Novosphingobium sp. PS1R-30]|uniref:Uncharacterized protein n=1 Tax=Novosphingobium anseongense TaxID=3133436 RepID=A0ABU8S2D1_9SPHN